MLACEKRIKDKRNEASFRDTHEPGVRILCSRVQTTKTSLICGVDGFQIGTGSFGGHIIFGIWILITPPSCPGD